VILFGEVSLSRVLSDTALIIIARGTIKGRATDFSFQRQTKHAIYSVARLNVVSDSAACSNITSAPHEYFYQTGIDFT
jgi:hypothetical protein